MKKVGQDDWLFLIFESVTLAARLLAEIGDNRERYATANSLQCEAGTAPVTRKSGKTLSVVVFRRACKKHSGRHSSYLRVAAYVSALGPGVFTQRNR